MQTLSQDPGRTRHGEILEPAEKTARRAARKRERKLSFRLGFHVVFGLCLAAFLVVGLGGWAATARLSGAVIAQGQVTVDRNVKEVQHRDGGIVAEIAVSEGDYVEEGQVLVRLDDAQTRAELMIIRSQIAEFTGRGARLEAESMAAESLTLPEGYLASHPDAMAIAAAETRLFQANLDRRRSQTEQLALQIEQLREEITGLEAQSGAKNQEAALVGEQRRDIQSLVERGYAERSRLYALDRDLSNLAGERAEIRAAMARAQVRMSEIRLQMIEIEDTLRTEAQAELRSVTARLAELRERQTAVQDRLERSEIRAPLAGVVNELDVHTVSGVVTPAQRILTIVPAGAALSVEVNLPPRDIEQIYLGQTARLRFSAFNQRTTPEVEGRVAHIPAAATQAVEGEPPFYRGKIEIGDISALGDVVLLPGMPVEVFIETEELPAISYLAKPFTDQISRAFREE